MNLTSAVSRDKLKQIMCGTRRGDGLLQREWSVIPCPWGRTIISRVFESVPKMESPCSFFSISKVADDTRMYCCAVADIVNLENSLKNM